MSDPKTKISSVDEIVNLHAAGFMAVASQIALKIQDPLHLNGESRDAKEAFDELLSHFKNGFAAKNVKANAERVLEKQMRESGK